MNYRTIEPKRHSTGYLYHNCPDTGENIQLDDCNGCPFFASAEILPTRYRVFCQKPIDGAELRQITPAKAYDKIRSLSGDALLTTDTHTIIQPKFDGARAIVHCLEDGSVYVTSRRKNKQGQYNQFQDNIPHIRDHKVLKALGRKGYTILDAEIIAPVDDDTLAITMGIVGSLPEKAIAKQEEIGYAVLYIFDTMQWHSIDTVDAPLTERMKLIKRIKTDDYIKITPSKNVTANTRKKVAKGYLDAGLEGAILKDPNAGYNSSRAWLKWKERTTVDVLITGWEKGAKGGKYAKTLGAFKVSVIDGATNKLREIAKVVPGDDETREKHYKILNGMSNKKIREMAAVVELEGQSWTKDGRIRHPRIIRYRLDRSDPNVIDFGGRKPEVR